MNNKSKNSSLLFKFLVFCLIWITIDGVFRKWVFPSLSSSIFVLKYVFFTLAYLSYYISTGIKNIKTTYQFFIIVLVSWCILQFTNDPYKSPLLVKVFGVVLYLFFIPLTNIIPTYFNTISIFEKLIKVIAYISVPIFILGIIQYYLPPDHILNSFVNDEQKYSVIETYTRSISIFTFVKIYSNYLLFVLTLFIAYIFYLSYLGRSTWFYTILLVLGILNLIMTAARLQIFAFGFNSILISFFAFMYIKKLRKHVSFILIISIVLSLSLYNLTEAFKSSTDAFIDRIRLTERAADEGLKGWSTEDRVIDRLNIFIFSEQAGWLGLGIGTTYQGTGNFLSKYFKDGYEEEGERIVLELGIIGGIIIFLLRLSILLYSIKVLIRIRDIKFFLLALPFTLFLFPPTIFLTEQIFNYYDAFTYWFAFSLVLGLEKGSNNLITDIQHK